MRVRLIVADDVYGYDSVLEVPANLDHGIKFGRFEDPKNQMTVVVRVRCIQKANLNNSSPSLKISRETADLYNINNEDLKVSLNIFPSATVVSRVTKCILTGNKSALDISLVWAKVCVHGLFLKSLSVLGMGELRFDCDSEIGLVDRATCLEYISQRQNITSATNLHLIRSSDAFSESGILQTLAINCPLLENQNLMFFDDVNILERKHQLRMFLESHSIKCLDQEISTQTEKSSLGMSTNSKLWDKIGGYKNVINQIKFHLDSLSLNSKLFEEMGIKPPKGILLYGPPGCSKTMIARTIAKSYSCHFISVKGAEVFKKWVGDSEKAVKKIFDEARIQSPAVVFFDEFDAIAGTRVSSNTVENRVIGQILSEMDGLSYNSQVIVLAATNRPDILDPAILRAGRFDIHIHVPLPDLTDRKDILCKELSSIENISPNYDDLARCMAGLSGAEIVNICRKALVKFVKEGDVSVDLFKEQTESILRSRAEKELRNKNNN